MGARQIDRSNRREAAGIRAFIALKLSAAVEDAIARFIDEFRRSGDAIGWTRAGNLHITLKFLGAAVDAAKLPPLIEALDAIASTTAPFEISACGTGAFPSLSRPRVLWIGLKSPALAELAARVETAATRAGFARETHLWSPHLTLGRVRDPQGAATAAHTIGLAHDREFGSSRAVAMHLYRSYLHASGAVHESLARFDFAAPASIRK